jgi:hypothetical protein
MKRPSVSKRILTDMNLKSTNEQSKEVHALLDAHVEALLYNAASILSVLVLMRERSKIECKDVAELRDYIEDQCNVHKRSGQRRGQTGGFPSEYFGYNFNAYSENNTGNEQIVSQAQFGEGGFIRPDINITASIGNTQSGGAAPVHHPGALLSVARSVPAIKKYLSAVFKNNGISISKRALKDLLLVLDIHITCLFVDIQNQTSNTNLVTESKVNRVLAIKRHSVFN